MITVIILTFNEEENIERAIISCKDWATNIIVLDSFSNDLTIELVKKHNVPIYFRRFDNYASQRNYAIKELPITTEWIFFLDADEYLTEELKQEISNELRNSKVDGYYLNRKFYFMGKWIRWGGYYPVWILRLFRKNCGYFQREINEHVVLNGKFAYLKNYFVDDNQKSLAHWWKKHIDFAEREAEALINRKKEPIVINFFGGAADRKLWLRYKIWNNLPPYIRPFFYFFYTFFYKLGILNGARGFLYHFYHGLVYHMIIDSLYIEKLKKSKEK